MNLTELEESSFSRIRDDWMGKLPAGAHEVYGAEYQQLFDRIEACKAWGALDGRVNQGIFHGVVDDGGVPWAIVEIVQSKKGAETWIKMLDIIMSPDIEAEADNERSTRRRMDVFSSTLSGIFLMSKEIRQANTLKVYGRTDLLVTFLRGMHDHMSVLASLGMISGVSVSIEGRWLVFRASQ